MTMRIKTPTTLMNQFCKANLTNQFRYYLALRLLDQSGSGKVDIQVFLKEISEAFSVKEKTVLNNLYKLLNERFIYAMDDSYIYYPRYDKLVQNHLLNVNHKQAVWVTLEDLSSIVRTRALFSTAFLTRSKNISRAKREELTGVSAKTQRKYEEELNIGKRFNHAILGEYSDYLFTYYKEIAEFPVYIYTDEKGIFGKPGQKYVARQTVNTYETGKSGCRYRKLRNDGGSVNAGTTYNRIFHDDNVPTASTENDQYYFVFSNLWGFIPKVEISLINGHSR